MRTCVVVAALALCSCGTGSSVQEQIRADAVERSGHDCENRRGGCEITISQTDEGWFVTVDPATFSPDGERVWIPGAKSHFYYGRDGAFLREMPDL